MPTPFSFVKKKQPAMDHRLRSLQRCIDERLRVRMLWLLDDGVGRSLLDDAAVVHDEGAVAKLLHEGEVVADKENGEAGLPAQISEQLEDLLLHGDIEGAGGFVADEQLWLDGEGTGDRSALSLTAADFVGIASSDLWRESALDEKVCHARFSLATRAAVCAQAFADAVAKSAPRIKRGGWLLKNHLHLLVIRAQSASVERADLLPIEADRAGTFRNELQNGAGKGALPAAGAADDAEGFMARQRKMYAVNSVERGRAARKTHAEPAHFQQWIGHLISSLIAALLRAVL